MKYEIPKQIYWVTTTIVFIAGFAWGVFVGLVLA